MRFHQTLIPGAFVIESEPHADERGSFARVYCRDTFASQNIDFTPVQSSLSHNKLAGTLRGLHYQAAPHEEQKLVACVKGSIYDVILDLRPDSPAFLKWYATELSAENGRLLFVPGGVAHGFQTLTDESVLLYQISEAFRAELSRGVRWDDPKLAIPWPKTSRRILSDKDRALPLTDDVIRRA